LIRRTPKEYMSAATHPMITDAHGSVPSHDAVDATNPTMIPLQMVPTSYYSTYEYVPVIRPLKKPAKRAADAGAIKLFIMTLAAPFFLLLKIIALPPLKKSQHTQSRIVPVRMSPGL
jgi:hypothetical protein